MPFNGAGTFTLVTGNPVVTGTVISSTVNNNTNSDFATGFTTCVTKDGQTTPTANLPMGGFKHTSVADATSRNQYASLGQIQDVAGSYVATVGGTADVITLTPSPAITAYAAGQVFRFIASGANTTNVTVAVSGLAAKAITKNGTTALVAGDIPSGAIVEITYDGTQFQITKIKQGTASPVDVGTSGATLGLLNANKTDSGNNTHSGTTTITGAVTNQNIYNYAASSGTDTYTATLSPAIASYVTGAHYFISFGNANTSTTPTINLNSIGAKTIVKNGSAALSAGDIPAGHKAILVYDGTNMVLANPLPGSTTAANGCSLVLISTTTLGSDTATIAVPSCFSSTYDEYEIGIVAAAVDTADALASLQITTDNGSTWKSTNEYDWEMDYRTQTGASGILNAQDTTGILLVATGVSGISTTAGGHLSGKLYFNNAASSSLWKHITGEINYDANSGASFGLVVDARYQATTAMTGFRLLLNGAAKYKTGATVYVRAKKTS